MPTTSRSISSQGGCDTTRSGSRTPTTRSDGGRPPPARDAGAGGFGCLVLGLLLALVAAAAGAGQLPLGAGGLAGLAAPHRGRAMSSTSADPTGGNADYRVVAPGDSITILDYRGAGIVRRFHMTFYPRPPLGAPAQVIAAHRQVILRMYWDGEKSPSVEVPIGDFFGVGFGEQRDYVSLRPETSGGYNSYWPMPFHHRC